MDGSKGGRGFPLIRTPWTCPRHRHLSSNPRQPQALSPIASPGRTSAPSSAAGKFPNGGIVPTVVLAVHHVRRSKQFHFRHQGSLVRHARGGEQIEFQEHECAQLLPTRQQMPFHLVTNMIPFGDQPYAIKKSVGFLQEEGKRFVTLHGATGTGKTFVMANIIEQLQQPCLLLYPNKTLAKQVFDKFTELFGGIPVDLFVSPFKAFRPARVIIESDREECTYLPSSRLPNQEAHARRLKCLSGMRCGGPRIVVASSSALFPCSGTGGKVLPTPLRKGIIEAIRKDLRKTCERICPAAGCRLMEMVQSDVRDIQQCGKCSEMLSKYGHLFYGPRTLIDLFTECFGSDWICMLDESHRTIPHLKNTACSSRSRCEELVQYGYRLHSTLKVGPLSQEEFVKKLPDQVLFASATPGQHSDEIVGEQSHLTLRMEQRPTHILDPTIEVREVCGESADTIVDMVIDEVSKVKKSGQQCMVGCTSKLQAELFALYSMSHGIKGGFIHCDQDFSEREGVIASFRRGELDMLCAIGLAQEGLDFPNVSTVIVLNADVRTLHFRTRASLTQLAGRASRNVGGHVIFFARKMTSTLREVIEEFSERRKRQQAYNYAHGYQPTPIQPTVKVREGRWRGKLLPRGLSDSEKLVMEDKGSLCWQVKPELCLDHVALVGGGGVSDPIPSVGPVAAARLLDEFGSLDEVLRYASSENTQKDLHIRAIGRRKLKEIQVYEKTIMKNRAKLHDFRERNRKKFRRNGVTKVETLGGKRLSGWVWDSYVAAVCLMPRGVRGRT